MFLSPAEHLIDRHIDFTLHGLGDRLVRADSAALWSTGRTGHAGAAVALIGPSQIRMVFANQHCATATVAGRFCTHAHPELGTAPNLSMSGR
jgi:hypothetical protein